jgi:hypothetical protein
MINELSTGTILPFSRVEEKGKFLLNSNESLISIKGGSFLE